MKRFVVPILLTAALPAADSRIAAGMNAFTTASYKQLVGGDSNLILSPFNIATALSMALAGARGPLARLAAGRDGEVATAGQHGVEPDVVCGQLRAHGVTSSMTTCPAMTSSRPMMAARAWRSRTPRRSASQ